MDLNQNMTSLAARHQPRGRGAHVGDSLALCAVALLVPATAFAGEFQWTVQGFYVIDFLLLVGILVWGVRKPLKSYLEKRRSNVVAEIERAQQLKADAEALLSEYRAKLADLEAERKRILEDFVRAGERERERIMSEAHQAADRMVAETERRVEQEGKRLVALLEIEVIEAAMTAAEEQVKSRVNDDVDKRLVDDALRAIETSSGRLSAMQ